MSIVFSSEVCKALNKTRGLYRRWLELQDDTTNSVSKDELEWTTTELRNGLRSIEWDLEDLEDTIDILLGVALYCVLLLSRRVRRIAKNDYQLCHVRAFVRPHETTRLPLHGF